MGMGYVPCDPFSWTCTLEVYAYFALVGWPWTLGALSLIGVAGWLIYRRASHPQVKENDAQEIGS